MERISPDAMSGLPTVSIVIPCGGSHHQYVGVAVASCVWQTYPNLEVIVVDDGPVAIGDYADSRVKVIKSRNHGATTTLNRPACARNDGIAHATGQFVIFLDADDYLLPKGIEVLIRGHASHDRAYTFSSHYAGTRHQRPPDYDQKLYAKFNIHPITCLIPLDAVRAVGGFDERAPGWEDWTLYLRLAIAGYCGAYYRGPIFVYQVQHSIVHHADVAGGQELMDRVIAPYQNEKGEVAMACCGSSPKTAFKTAVATLGEAPAMDGMQTLEYIGDQQGSFILQHPVSKRTYKAGRNASVRYLNVPAEDVSYFLAFGTFRVVMPETPYTPPPAPAELAEVVEAVEPVVDVVIDDHLKDVIKGTTTTVKTTLRAPKKG